MAWPRQQVHSPAMPASGAVSPPPATEQAPRPLPRGESPPTEPDTQSRTRLPDFLPPEAADTIALIRRGGPFPHRQDGSVFGNREGRLPRKTHGWYREYTVDTPRLSHRGARRIITGGDPPSEWYYTDDHYDSFRRFDATGGLQ
ncbi:ribonuclease [Thermomonas sp. HDW16]|nr:ribonuclease [Thermomonas sp. HDW16]